MLAVPPPAPPNTIPASPVVLPELRRINLSSTLRLVTCACIVSPVTFKSPAIVTLPVVVTLANVGESPEPNAFTSTFTPFIFNCP